MNDRALIEAVLFSASKPLKPSEISRITKIPGEKVEHILKDIAKEYESIEHGIQLKISSKGYRFFIKPQYSEYAEKVTEKRRKDLTIQQIEVLAYIAYKGPLTRKELMELRGKSVDGILRELLSIGLIARRRSSRKGKPYEYRITKRFEELFEPYELEEILNEAEKIHTTFKEGVEKESGSSDKTKESKS